MTRFEGGGKAAALRAARVFASLLALSAAFAAIPAAAQDSVVVHPQADGVSGDSIGRGDSCPVAGYCQRVPLQVHRFFRAPPGSAGARGEVCFRILRDGSVADITTQNVRDGGAAFRLALMEAVDAAGRRRAFGPLPAEFDPQRLRWCVEMAPR